jgi:hypothetical protein
MKSIVAGTARTDGCSCDEVNSGRDGTYGWMFVR